MIIKAPQNIKDRLLNKPSVFLAGSIEMGKAVDWQTELGNLFDSKGWNVFNPRRDDWDSSWEQKITNPQFNEQVNWELNALEEANLIVMYFDPKTQSPISLLELGLHAKSSKMIVVCPEGFWRKGNVDIVCKKYNIPLFSNMEKVKLYLEKF